MRTGRSIPAIAAVLVLAAACTAGGATRESSPASVAPSASPSPTPPIGTLVDVVGDPIELSSLEGRIAFSGGVEDVYMIDADGSGLRRLTSGGGLDFDPTWSPDGSSIAYRHQDGDEGSADIFVVPATGGDGRNLTRSRGVADWGPDWSPSGTSIVWNSDVHDPQGGLLGGYWMRPDGSAIGRIRSRMYIEYPSWSPDGTKIAFMAPPPDRSDEYEIYVVNVDGTGLRRLTHSDGPDGWPSWSPDGTQIAFSSVRDDCSYSDAATCLRTGDIGPYHTIYLMNADGSDEHRLNRTFGQFPAWSPDGTYVLFAPWLNVIRPDGTGLTRIEVSGVSGEPEMPDWVA